MKGGDELSSPLPCSLFTKSNRHQFLLFRLEQLIDPLNLRIGQLLHLFIRALLIVGGDRLVLRRLLDRVIPIAPDVPDRRRRCFRPLRGSR